MLYDAIFTLIYCSISFCDVTLNFKLEISRGENCYEFSYMATWASSIFSLGLLHETHEPWSLLIAYHENVPAGGGIKANSHYKLDVIIITTSILMGWTKMAW